MADIIDLAAERNRRATCAVAGQGNAAPPIEEWPDYILMDLMEQIDEAGPAGALEVMLRFERTYGP